MAIVGSFQEDLDIYLADYKGRSGASKQSDIDLKSIGSTAKGELENGKMYSFEYFTPDETFYDTYPIVLGLGRSIDNHQLAVNLHYIPYEARIPFLSDVVRSFKNVISTQINNSPGLLIYRLDWSTVGRILLTDCPIFWITTARWACSIF